MKTYFMNERRNDLMYISQFWCGVLTTIGVEFIGIIAYAIKLEMNKKKGE